MKPLIGISMGDMNGVGPEITLKCLSHPAARRNSNVLLVGSADVYASTAERLGMHLTFREVDSLPGIFPVNIIHVLPVDPYRKPRLTPGRLSAEAGSYAAKALLSTVRLCLKGVIDGMVTAPVSKEAMNAAGYRWPGQTDVISSMAGAPATMMLVAGGFRVGLATIHIPLGMVSRKISEGGIGKTLTIMCSSLRRDFGIRLPRIAVLGLNPHAGENGLLGSEETDRIAPAIRAARRRNIRAEGPFPADGFFGAGTHRKYDAILAMYHDQGLIPLKMASFTRGVNYSAGLPIVRTSPDHGTAFDIAGKGRADEQSMLEALKLAVRIIHNRTKHPR